MVGFGPLLDIEAPVVSGGDFCPPADDTFDLGSSTRAWADGHFDGIIYTDDILEHGSGQGVTIDGVQLKDNNIYLASGAVIDFNSANQTITHDNATTTLTITGKMAFGGNTDWGTGSTGTLITGAGYDWVTQTIGRINANLNNTAAAAAYFAITVGANQTGSNSVFGIWTELYIKNSINLTGADNFAAVWGQFEAGTGVTLSDTGCFTAGGYFNVKAGSTLVVPTGHSLNGVRAQIEVTAITNNGTTAAFECLKKGGVDWEFGLYLADVGTDIRFSSGTTLTDSATTLTLAGAILAISDATASTSTASGCLTLAGGLGVGEDIYMAGDLYIASGNKIDFNAGNVTITHSSGLLTLVGNLTIDVGDLQLGDNDYLMFGDAAGGDATVRWTGTYLQWGGIDGGSEQILWGSDGNGIHQTWYTDTGGDYMSFDRTSQHLIFYDTHIHLMDYCELRFGSQKDVWVEYLGNQLRWQGLRGGSQQIMWGSDGAGIHLTWFTDTTGSYMSFDRTSRHLMFSGDIHLQLNDNAELRFGSATGGDVVFKYDGTYLKVTGAGLTGGGNQILWGADSTGANQTWYTDTSGDYMWFDAGSKIFGLMDVYFILSSFASGLSQTGCLWLDTTDDKLHYYDGSAEQTVLDLTGGALTGNLLIAATYGIVIGSTTVQLTTTGFFCKAQLQVLGTDNDTSSLTIARFSNDNTQPGLRFVKSKGTTITDGTAGAVASGVQLGTVAWYGDDGTDLKTAVAQIEVNVTDTVAENQIPTKMMFSTTTTGGTRTTALTIDDDQSATFTGAVIIGTIGITGTVRALDITTTTSETSGNCIGIEVEHTRDTDSASGRDWGIKSTMKVDNNAKFPGGVNAVYGSLELGTGGAHGRAAGLQGELIMPNGQLTRGTFSCLHADLTESGNTNTGSAGPISFVSCVGGGTLTNFDARGNLFEITGFTSGSGKFYYNNTLRMLVAGTTKYLPLSTTEGKFTGTLGAITASNDITLSDIKIINLKAGTSAINPESAHRGQFYFIEGVGGVADLLYCIMKGAGDAYSAIQVAIG